MTTDIKTLKLRDYQTDAITAVYADWADGITRTAIVLPTGMGKTVIFADMVRREHESNRVTLILVHRDELVRQTVAKLEAAAPGATIGVIKAERNEYGEVDVVVASVQTLGRLNRLVQVPSNLFNMIIVDECHHASATSYQSILTHFGAFEDFAGTTTVGFTATMSRADGGALGRTWEKISYRKDITYGIAKGHLADVRGVQVTVDGLSLADVAKSRGDYQEGGLGDAMIASGAGAVIADAYWEHASALDEFSRPVGPRPGILFAPTVACAEAFADDLNDAGIPTEVVIGTTPAEDRQLVYKRVRAGETKIIASCMVLTEGFDLPEVEVAIIARPTTNAALYVQMVGRVLRPAPWSGKTGALVLDVVGVAGKLPLATIADLTITETKPLPGESLMEALERESEAQDILVAERGRIEGERTGVEVELFHASRVVWLQTTGGKWFIPTRTNTIFLWPRDDGTYDVGKCDVYTTKNGSWLHKGLPVEMAMSWGEQEADELDPSVSTKASSWREKSRKPSDAQVALAARLGLDSAGMNRGELSDAISVVYASRILDRTAKGAKK